MKTDPRSHRVKSQQLEILSTPKSTPPSSVQPSLIKRQLTTGNNHRNLSNDSTNYAPFSCNKSQTQRSSTVSPLRPDTTDDGQTYVPTSNSKLRTPKCKQSASSNELPIQHLMHCFTIPYTGNIYYLMAVAQLHHNSLLPTIVLTLINVSSWLPVNIQHMFSILHVVPIVLLLLLSC